MTQCGERVGSGGRRHRSLPALPFDEKTSQRSAVLIPGGAHVQKGRREAGQRLWGSGSRPCGDKTSRSCSGNLKSEGSPQAGSVFRFPSSSSSSFPHEEKNWEVELSSPPGPGWVTRVQGAEPHLAAELTSRSWRGRTTGPQTSLLDLYFNFRKELKKHALESQEGDKS